MHAIVAKWSNYSGHHICGVFECNFTLLSRIQISSKQNSYKVEAKSIQSKVQIRSNSSEKFTWIRSIVVCRALCNLMTKGSKASRFYTSLFTLPIPTNVATIFKIMCVYFEIIVGKKHQHVMRNKKHPIYNVMSCK